MERRARMRVTTAEKRARRPIDSNRLMLKT
jgi:hypothetical protein